MNESPIVIRGIESDAELDAFARLSRSIFTAHMPIEIAAPRWRQYVTRAPDYFPGMVRGAFRGNQFLGGYILYRRTLRIGPARIPFGGVGTVHTAPEFRGQGIARAMMHDIIALATERREALLLLDGVPDLYHRYGYVNVLDFSGAVFDRAAALAITSRNTEHPANRYTIRPADRSDAAALLAMYERYSGPVPGSFARTLEHQAHWLDNCWTVKPPWLAVDDYGNVHGFLTISYRHAHRAFEVGADNPAALLALAGHHARMLDAQSIDETELRWQMSPSSTASTWLADHLPVRIETSARPRSGWMARLVDTDVLVEALLPVWRERWHAAHGGFSGHDTGSVAHAPDLTIDLTIDTRRYALRLADDTRIGPWDDSIADPAVQLKLTGGTLMQLVCGYRSATWAADQPGNAIPATALPLLSMLFPTGGFWIPESDWF